METVMSQPVVQTKDSRERGNYRLNAGPILCNLYLKTTTIGPSVFYIVVPWFWLLLRYRKIKYKLLISIGLKMYKKLSYFNQRILIKKCPFINYKYILWLINKLIFLAYIFFNPVYLIELNWNYCKRSEV